MLLRILILLNICQGAFASYSIKSEINAGQTSNANYEKNDPHSDTYLKYALGPSVQLEDFNISGNISYQDYNLQNLNDIVSWKVATGYESELDEYWAWNGSVYLLANQYVNGSPETQDQNYSNAGAGIELGGEFKATDNISLFVSPLFESRKYQDSTSRTERTLALKGEVEYSLNKKNHFQGGIEGGIIDSSEDSYVRRYVQFAVSGLKSLSDIFGIGFEGWFKRTTYGKRKYSGAIRDRLGSSSSGTSENTSLVHFELELICQLTDNFSLAAVGEIESQTSASSNYDYKVNEYIIRAKYLF